MKEIIRGVKRKELDSRAINQDRRFRKKVKAKVNQDRQDKVKIDLDSSDLKTLKSRHQKKQK